MNGACFQPLYGTQAASTNDSVRDKLAAIDIRDIKAADGTPTVRIAVALQNALKYNFNGADTHISPIYRLDIIIVAAGSSSVIVDVASGRADTEVEVLSVKFSLTEIETKKDVLSATAFANASYDIPGSQQRFARQRAGRDAEDRVVAQIAQNIQNRLASYFVAGT
jgi:LPS-assembly lipoprotein